MTDGSPPKGRSISSLEDLSDKTVEEAGGLVRNDDGETRFTLEVVDNAGAGPYEE